MKILPYLAVVMCLVGCGLTGTSSSEWVPSISGAIRYPNYPADTVDMIDVMGTVRGPSGHFGDSLKATFFILNNGKWTPRDSTTQSIAASETDSIHRELFGFVPTGDSVLVTLCANYVNSTSNCQSTSK